MKVQKGKYLCVDTLLSKIKLGNFHPLILMVTDSGLGKEKPRKYKYKTAEGLILESDKMYFTIKSSK